MYRGILKVESGLRSDNSLEGLLRSLGELGPAGGNCTIFFAFLGRDDGTQGQDENECCNRATHLALSPNSLGLSMACC